MAKKPIGIVTQTAATVKGSKIKTTSEVYDFRSNCRNEECGKEILMSYKIRKFGGQMMYRCEHCDKYSPYTINYDNPWGIASKHPNHPPDSPGTLYLIEEE